MRNALPFHVSLVGRKNLSREIYRQIKAAILDGRLRPQDRLSPSRELARALSVSRMTVTVAYEWLAGDGFIHSQHGAGTYVAETVRRPTPPPAASSPRNVIKSRPIWNSVRMPMSFTQAVRYDFRVGLPESGLFPHRAWQRSVMKALTSNESAMGRYEDPIGHRKLRDVIARQIGFSRGVQAVTENILITNGTQQALDVLARALLEPGDTIAVEEPGYTTIIDLFRSLGLQVVGVPVDADGLIVSSLPKNARAVYVTPSHQFPLTVTMSLPRRRELLAWAERRDAAIIEDDYDSEFRFGGRPCEPLQTIDTAGRVIYVGSFSKTLLPTLRVGFVVAPPGLIPALERAKFVADWHTPTLPQAAIAHFIEDGGYARHLRKMTSIYRDRHDLLTETIARDFSDHFEIVPSSIGLHLAAVSHHATPAEIVHLSERASTRQIALQCLSRFSSAPTPPSGILLGYGGIPTARIKEGLRLLRACL